MQDVLSTRDIFNRGRRKILSTPEAQKVLAWFVQKLPTLTNWEVDTIQEVINDGISELGIKGKAFYLPLRLALIGKIYLDRNYILQLLLLVWKNLVKRLKRYLLKMKNEKSHESSSLIKIITNLKII